MYNSEAYKIIKRFYGDKKAVRSDVPLMNHINEGIAILESIYASQWVKDAFCIHPIVQNYHESEEPDVYMLDCYMLAYEYRIKANAYLCTSDTDWVDSDDDIKSLVGDMSFECAQMLFADKIQNRKDFRLYHSGSHERTVQLERYFNNWIGYLEKLLNSSDKG